MGYEVRLISPEEGRAALASASGLRLRGPKADIFGICVQLLAESRAFADMWEDNFYMMGDSVRHHARVVCLDDPSRGTEVLYDRSTFTAFLYNFTYYGWVKSVALAVASDILEDAHSVNHVHGAALDADGRGVAFIAPPKAGKTTHSWGLLRAPHVRLVSDDWFFVKLTDGRPIVHGSERNCYISADIGDIWEEYRPLVGSTEFDSSGRGVSNVRWVAGEDSVASSCALRTVFLLKRDPDDEEVVEELTADEAVRRLRAEGFCNPHMLRRGPEKTEMRAEFFRRCLSQCDVFSVNTVLPPEEVQARIRAAMR